MRLFVFLLCRQTSHALKRSYILYCVVPLRHLLVSVIVFFFSLPNAIDLSFPSFYVCLGSAAFFSCSGMFTINLFLWLLFLPAKPVIYMYMYRRLSSYR